MKSLKAGLNYKALMQRNTYGLYIHEYQAHDLLKKYKLPLVPVSIIGILGIQGQYPRRRLCHCPENHVQHHQEQALRRCRHQSPSPCRGKRKGNFQGIRSQRRSPDGHASLLGAGVYWQDDRQDTGDSPNWKRREEMQWRFPRVKNFPEERTLPFNSSG